MNEKARNFLDEMSAAEVLSFKKELTEYMKERKERDDQQSAENFERTVNVGDVVRFIFKDEETTGEVVKINKSTFSVLITDEFGETVKRPIRFTKFVEKVEI